MQRVNNNAKMDAVETWLNSVAYSHSNAKSTHDNYKRNLAKFCSYTGLTPEDILADYERAELHQASERTLKRKYSQLLQNWISSFKGQDYTSSSIQVMVTAVKSFFKYNDLEIGFIPPARRHGTYHNRDINKEDILQIRNVSGVREAAFYLFMAQSGLRPHTICSLKYKNIQPDFEAGTIPCCVTVSEDQTKGAYRGYFTFIAEDAVNALRAYLNTRGEMTPESLLFTQQGSDDKVLYRGVVSHIFGEAVKKLNRKGVVQYSQKQKGKAGTVRLYSLRKYFRRQAGQAGLDYVQFWMGHILKNQDEHYFKPQEGNEESFSKEAVECHRKVYAEKAMPHLRLESTTPTEHDRIIEAQKVQISELTKKVSSLLETQKENRELKETAERMSEFMATFSEAMHMPATGNFMEKFEAAAQKRLRLKKISEEYADLHPELQLEAGEKLSPEKHEQLTMGLEEYIKKKLGESEKSDEREQPKP